jgi:hypothetical protein
MAVDMALAFMESDGTESQGTFSLMRKSVPLTSFMHFGVVAAAVAVDYGAGMVQPARRPAKAAPKRILFMTPLSLGW